MSKIQFDHVIALLPYNDIINPPAWVTKNFTLSPGGRHGDGRTENRLILFKDGTYLELIAFIDDDAEKRRGHWWDRSFGVVDYALTTAEAHDFTTLKAKLQDSGTGIGYAGPLYGARTRPDGVEIKWQLMFPEGAERGGVPFWCHDLTLRDRRVPITPENTNHPCGAVGVGGMVLKTDTDNSKRLASAIDLITQNSDKSMSTPIDSGTGKLPKVTVVEDAASSKHYRLSLVLQTQGNKAPADIELDVGDGHVSIQFDAVDGS